MELTNWDDVPLIITPKIIIGMGVKKTQTYEWFHSSGFPLIKDGRSLYVEKIAFKNWLERRGSNEENNEMTRVQSKPSHRR